MYLAEDRLLAQMVFSKKNSGFKLKFIPDSNVSVDPVTNLATLSAQRKRWTNGGWHAFGYVLNNLCIVRQSTHPFQVKYIYYPLIMAYSALMRWL